MYSNDYTLMIIDMQPFFLSDKAPEDLRVKIAYQNAMIQKARDGNCPILLIEHNWVSQRTTDELSYNENDFRMEKPGSDGFYNKNLAELLGWLCPETIHVLGCNVNACVYDTVMSAIERGFNVTAHRQGLLAPSSSEECLDRNLRKFERKGIRII